MSAKEEQIGQAKTKKNRNTVKYRKINRGDRTYKSKNKRRK